MNPVRRVEEGYTRVNGRFYERTRQRVDGGIRFGLRPVTARAVLDAVAVAVDLTDDETAVRTVVTEGTATLDGELTAPNRVVTVDGDHYVFELQRAETPRTPRADGPVVVAAGVGFLLGLWSLRRGWLHYDAWRA
jgi:hypothetical protein